MKPETAVTQTLDAPSRLNRGTVRIIAFIVALIGSVWFWSQSIATVLGYSFLTSLTPTLAPVMVSGIVFFALGFITGVLLLIATIRKNLPVAYSALFWAASIVTWLLIYYVSALFGA